MPKSEARLSVALTRSDKVRFRAMCRREGTSMSEYIAAEIRHILDQMAADQDTEPAKQRGA